MADFLAMLAGMLIMTVPVMLARWLDPVGADRPGREEPCWTEEIGGDGRFSYGRGRCFREDLRELDARARNGDFPVAKSWE